MFRDIVQNVIKSYEERKDENGNTYLPYGSSRRTIITSAFGSRVIRFLFHFTNLALRKMIEKYNPKANIHYINHYYHPIYLKILIIK